MYVLVIVDYHPLSSLTDVAHVQAKDEICLWIDNYIRDRIIIADQVIQETAVKKIHNGDVILTYARYVLRARACSYHANVSVLNSSSVVEKVLLEAWSEGTQFSVVVVDSRPMLEGMQRRFSLYGIPLTRHVRQTSTIGTRFCWPSLLLCSPSLAWLYHHGSFHGIRRCAFNKFKRSRVLASRDRAGRYDGQTTLRPGRCVLRDVQIQ